MNDIHPFHPPFEITLLTSTEVLILCSVGVLLLGVLFHIWQKKKRALAPHPKTVKKPRPKRPFAKAEKLLRAESWKEFSVEIARILKECISLNQQSTSLESMTTEEIHSLSQLSPEAKTELLALLTQLDSVKFAQGTCGTEMGKEILQQTKKWRKAWRKAEKKKEGIF